MTALLFLAALAALVALAVAPLLLPWHHHVRWLVIANATSEPRGPVPRVDLHIDEVRVSEPSGDLLWITRQGKAPHRAMLAHPSEADIRWLESWAIAGTPLLQLAHRDGTISVHGPTYAVHGLRPAGDLTPAGLGDTIEEWLREISEASR